MNRSLLLVPISVLLLSVYDLSSSLSVLLFVVLLSAFFFLPFSSLLSFFLLLLLSVFLFSEISRCGVLSQPSRPSVLQGVLRGVPRELLPQSFLQNRFVHSSR